RNRKAFTYGSLFCGEMQDANFVINTGDSHPISLPPYRASPAGREFIEQVTAEFLEADIIEESVSAWAAPVVITFSGGKLHF
ncbi:hypothetical protein BT69DRAFT_1194283, partial [Atractiella rhizophila]